MTKTKLFFLAGVITAVVALLQGAETFAISSTDSIDGKLFYKSSLNPSKGEFAAFCTPPNPILEFNPKWSEMGWPCTNSNRKLIKPIAATEGDVVHITAQGVHVNGVLIENTLVKPKGLSGKSAQAYSTQPFTLKQGEVFFISNFHEYSFDSRYFGPVQLKNLTTYKRIF